MHIGFFRRRCIFNINRQLNPSMIIAFKAIFCDFPVCFRVQILRFDSRDISDVAGNVRIDACGIIILLFLSGWLIWRDVTHISGNRILFILDLYHRLFVIMFYYQGVTNIIKHAYSISSLKYRTYSRIALKLKLNSAHL